MFSFYRMLLCVCTIPVAVLSICPSIHICGRCENKLICMTCCGCLISYVPMWNSNGASSSPLYALETDIVKADISYRKSFSVDKSEQNYNCATSSTSWRHWQECRHHQPTISSSSRCAFGVASVAASLLPTYITATNSVLPLSGLPFGMTLQVMEHLCCNLQEFYWHAHRVVPLR